MNENLEFEQNYYPRTAKGIHNNGHIGIRLKKWLASYDRFHYGNMNYYDLMGSILKSSNELS